MDDYFAEALDILKNGDCLVSTTEWHRIVGGMYAQANQPVYPQLSDEAVRNESHHIMTYRAGCDGYLG